MVRNPGFEQCATPDCGAVFVKRSASHRYCEPCSSARHAERQRKWNRENPAPKEVQEERREARRSRSIENGIAISAQHKEAISWNAAEPVLLEWLVRISVPFSYSYSKNALFTNRPGGHVAMRREARDVRDTIRDELALELRRTGISPMPGKLWLDLYVQKSNHKGDAVNVIDLVCDGVKEATGVDDRWFSIRRLDWQIVKDNPRIYIGVGQDITEPMQACSHCGRVMTYDAFGKKASSPNGIDRACKECRRVSRKPAAAD